MEPKQELVGATAARAPPTRDPGRWGRVEERNDGVGHTLHQFDVVGDILGVESGPAASSSADALRSCSTAVVSSPEAHVGAAAELLTPLLIGLGVDELSATSVIVPRVKKAVQSLDASRCEDLVRTALTMEDSAAIQQMSLEMARERYAEIAD